MMVHFPANRQKMAFSSPSRTILLISAILLMLLFSGCQSGGKKQTFDGVSDQPQKPIPPTNKQVYALAGLTDPNLALLLDHPEIDGISLQAAWMNMETSNNNFFWADLDSALKLAKDRGKGVTLRPLSAFRSGAPMVEWMKTQGMQTFIATNNLGVTSELALPWDDVFLSQYIEFLNALSLHINQAGYADTLVRIQVSAPVNEMDIPPCRNNIIGNTFPYDRAKYLSSWERTIDAFNAAFPDTTKLISANGGRICRPQIDEEFFRDVMGYASRKYNGFVPSANDLMTTGSDRMSPYLDLASEGLAYQMIWFSTKASNNRLGGTYPTNLLQSVCKGIDDGADYIEIYAVDVLNPDSTIQSAIQAVHDSSLCG
jgi:hypothetical protein